MKFKYCPMCSKKLVLKEIGDEGLVPHCVECGKRYLDVPRTSIISVVINEANEVALIRQNYVSKTNWVLVAGYIKSGESVEETVVREIKEEIGLEVTKIKYMESYYYEKKDLLLLGFVAFTNKKQFAISNEVDQCKWFTLEEANKKLIKGSIGERHFNNVKKYVKGVNQ